MARISSAHSAQIINYQSLITSTLYIIFTSWLISAHWKVRCSEADSTLFLL